MDYYWKALSNKGGNEGPCGWCKDKYGLSWKVVPAQYFKLENHKNKAKQEYAFKAVMKMKKIIIAELEEKNASNESIKDRIKDISLPKMQLSIFDAHSQTFEEIRLLLENTDINRLTPVEALLKLQEIKNKIQ